MPPKIKVQREEVIDAALQVAREKGIEAVTAREVARTLGVSVGPIFTHFASMEQLRTEVYRRAKDIYRAYIQRGLSEPIPFLGVWRQYIRCAREERELYKLLFLTRPSAAVGGIVEALRFSQDLARESLMRVYRMDAFTADCYFRDLWLVAFSIATMIVTDDCPYADEEIFAIGAEISLSVCKAYKEVPGLAEGKYDRDAEFRKLIGQNGERTGET